MANKIERMQLLKREVLKRITPEMWDGWTESQRGSIVLSLLDADYEKHADLFGYSLFVKAHKQIIDGNIKIGSLINLKFSYPKLLEILDLAARYANVWVFS